MVARPGSRRVRPLGQRPDAVDERCQDGVCGAQVRLPRARYGCPSTTPGTPVFVEYLGWMRISGRMECTACATATAASA